MQGVKTHTVNNVDGERYVEIHFCHGRRSRRFQDMRMRAASGVRSVLSSGARRLSPMGKREHMLEAVRDLLLREWDPIGVAHHPECCAEYDRYARSICRYLEEGIDEFRLAAYLAQVETVGMGLSRADEERAKLVAQRLLTLSA